MEVKKIETKLKDVFLLQPKVFTDERGYFEETYSANSLAELGHFLLDNESFNKEKNTIRGLHTQMNPNAESSADYSQAKIVRVVRGEVIDLVVDVRVGSPTYGKSGGFLLSESNKTQLFIPRGFLHGYITITEDVIFMYKVDNFYNAENSLSVNVFDSVFNFERDFGINKKDFILSEKDSKKSISFEKFESINTFTYHKNG